MAGNRLYLFTEKGIAIVAGAGRGQFQEFFRADMDDAFDASPAFVDGRIFLRGRKFVWCLGSATSLSVAGAAKSAEVSTATAPVLEKINPKDGATMVYVPAGEFLMGSKEGEGCDWERPQRKVTLDGFYIYKYDVTVAQYRIFCTETKRAMPPEPNWKWQDNHPIVNVTWHDANAYAAWAGVQLPTEAQWEWACRAGTTNITYWGDEVGDRTKANVGGPNDSEKTHLHWADDGYEYTAPIGSYPPNPWGLYDMIGNAREWVADWYAPFTREAVVDPVGPPTGGCRANKGDGWMHPFHRICSAYRDGDAPHDQKDIHGFRVGCAVE